MVGKVEQRLKIVACFKIVPDYEEILPVEWEDIEHIDFTFIKKMYGCYDEAALETALRLKDSLLESGAGAECIAVTLGTGASGLMNALYAAGFDRVVRIDEPIFDFEPEYTADLLAEYLAEEMPDLIITGKSTGPYDSGMVPAYLAAKTGAQWIPETTEISYNREYKNVEVICEKESCLIRVEAALPTLCSVGNAKFPSLRMFSLKARMEARKKEVYLWKSSQKADSEKNGFQKKRQTDRMKLVYTKIENHCKMIENDSIGETAQWLVKELL